MVGARNLVESRCPLLPTGTSIWAGDSLQLYYLFFPNEMFIVVGVLFCFSLKKIAYSTPTLSPTSPQAGIQTRKWGRLGREVAWVGSPGVGSGNC